MENNQTNKKNIRQEEPMNMRDLVFKCLVYWPWFAVCAVVFVISAYIYLRFQEPVYSISSTVLVKEQDERTKMMGTQGGAMSALQDMGGFTMSSSFDNELEILKSRTLVKKVVSELGLYINTYLERPFGYNKSLYKSSPVNVYLTPQEAEKLKSAVRIDMKYTPSGQLSAKASYNNELGEEKTFTGNFDKLPAVLPTPVGVFSFTPADSVSAIKNEMKLVSYIVTPKAAANSYSGSLSVAATSKTTTIAKVTLRNSNIHRGADFINALIKQYNEDANNEKNEVARKTAEFIEDRISIINAELGSTESELAAFKQRSGLTDISSDAQLAKEQSTRYDQERIQNATQISLVRFLQNYINNPANRNEVIPANVGLQDANLTSVIDKYNAMIIERKRLLNTSSESNPAVINLNSGIEAMRNSVQTSVQSVLKGLEIRKSDIDRQAQRYQTRISDAPQQEKEFMTIARQQEIKASLYIMLLKKREENAITLAATANNGRIIEAPEGGGLVAPKKQSTMLMALLIGLLLPAVIIYIRELLKFKIETPEDIERITDVSLLAEIPIFKETANQGIVVRENHNNVMEEMFRGLRTNLLFMMEPKDKVIMVSSSIPGEGKSFIACNTAVSMAFLGKKVLVMGMDIRKPGLNKIFKLSRRAEGITKYLSNPTEVNLFDLIQPSEISPNLDIITGGIVPPNPTELVARESLDKAIAMLKDKYDYIILDTAPIGMITDSAIISRVADICLYVCRADYTPKTSYQFINSLQSEKKIPKIATVLNGIDMSKRKHSYYYGYGKKYGYGKRYNYGYGYNYGKEEENKKK